MNNTRILEVNGHELAYVAHNVGRSKVPIVLLPGITVPVNFWEWAIPEYIEQRYTWYSVSLPGHYPSTFPEGFEKEEIDADFFYRQLAGAMDQLFGEQSVFFIGHSTGAFMALNYAMRRPERVKGVVSISGFGEGTWSGLEGLLQQMARGRFMARVLFYLSFGLLKLSRPLFKQAAMSYTHRREALQHDPLVNQTLEKIHPYIRRFRLRWMYYLFNRIPLLNIMDQLGELRQPTLLMAGDRDPVVPYGHALDLADAIPGADLHTFPRTGHLPFVERREDFRRVLERFVRDVAG